MHNENTGLICRKISDKEVIWSRKHEKTLQNDKKSKPATGFVVIISLQRQNWY
jgi:hypothetical protein